MKTYFLQKAHHLKGQQMLGRHKWLLSIKLDGMRAFWDGGISRNRTDCPWAPDVRATGLWSINAKVIHAPEWFLDGLPLGTPLDGELWAGPQNYQRVMSACKKHVPVDSEWSNIQFIAHTPISFKAFAVPRVINEPHCKLTIGPEVMDWCLSRAGELFDAPAPLVNPVWSHVPQRPFDAASFSSLPDYLDEIVEQGHEGICLLRADAYWSPVRSKQLLKLKPFHDAEGVVIGCTAGRETDKGSKLLSMMGTLVVKWKGHTVHISGFTEPERELASSDYRCDPVKVATAMEGSRLPDYIFAKHFPPGTIVTFKYRETYDSGLPKDARYFRKRVTE